MRISDNSTLKDQRRATRMNLALAVLSGCLLGFSFPPSPFYSLAYIAFVPFFFLMERMKSYAQLTRYSYCFIFVFHLITVYWTGGFTHMKDAYLMIAGSSLLILHPLFYIPSILLATFVRRRLGFISGLLSFVVLWIAYEYSHSLGQYSFPWLTIGNSQAYDLFRIQISEYTSAYGLSFLILSFNVMAFVWIVHTTSNRWHLSSGKSITTLASLFVLYMLPWYYGSTVVALYANPRIDHPFKLGLIQPNIDPFEKWGAGPTPDPIGRQINAHIEGTRSFVRDSVDLVLWCETAIPVPILAPSWNNYWLGFKSSLDAIHLPVLAGFPYVEFFDSSSASVTARRVRNSDQYVEDYNSIMLLLPGKPVETIYKKMKLVPFAERIPYAESFRFLIEPLKWSVGISGWGLGKDTVLFSAKSREGTEERFAGIICYESAFPDFVRQFVARGAQFIVILTNDSWWGNTSGAYQHLAFAPLRAVENRRWVVQCANGGISAFVDPAGQIHQATPMYTAASEVRAIEPRSGETFYVRHGDIFAKLCVVIALAFVFSSTYFSYYKK